MQFVMIPTVLSALATLAAGSALPQAGAITGETKWIGECLGKNVTLYGNATGIMHQLKTLDPDWIPMSQRPGFVPKNNSTLATRSESGPILCCPVSGQPWSPVPAYLVVQAANQLIDLGGNCVMNSYSCGLAVAPPYSACNSPAGIFLCSNTEFVVAPSCADIGNYAENIVYSCLGTGDNSGVDACGQVFDTGGWNVFVAGC